MGKQLPLTGATLFVGRVLLAFIFLWSGWHKLVAPARVAPFMTSHHIPFAGQLVYVVALTELLGGALVAIGWRAKVGAWLLFLFLIPTTLIFHTNLVVPFANPMEAQMQLGHALSNLAIMGGLLVVASTAKD